MPKLCNIDIEKSQEVYRKLDKFIEDLKLKFNISELYLFGSFASGQIHEGSDIDLLIVGDFEGRIFDRIEKIIGITDLPIEPLIYTKEEFEGMKKTNSFIRKIIEKGNKL